MRPTQNNVFVSGASGSGKSYFFTDWLTKDLLPWGNAHIITNLPLGRVPESHFKPPQFDGETFIDRISERIKRDVRHRFTLLDNDTLRSWERGQSGPWDLARGKGEAYLILDEFAQYCYIGMNDRLQTKWIDYLSKARHSNVHNLMISQSSQKIPRKLFLEFGEKWQLSDTASRVIPRLECTEGDINQLISKLVGREYARTQCIVRINEGGTWTGKDEMPITRIRRVQSVFELYDSFSAPEIVEPPTFNEWLCDHYETFDFHDLAADEFFDRCEVDYQKFLAEFHDTENRTKEWERFSWPTLLLWFASRNVNACCMFLLYGFFFSVCLGLGTWGVMRMDKSSNIINQSKEGQFSNGVQTIATGPIEAGSIGSVMYMRAHDGVRSSTTASNRIGVGADVSSSASPGVQGDRIGSVSISGN